MYIAKTMPELWQENQEISNKIELLELFSILHKTNMNSRSISNKKERIKTLRDQKEMNLAYYHQLNMHGIYQSPT